MARQGMKRKASDEAIPLPTKASKLRKAMASIAHAATESEASSSAEELFMRGRIKLATTTAPTTYGEKYEKGKRRKRDMIDIESEEEMTETQQLLAIAKLRSKGKKEAVREAEEYLNGFEKRVREGRQIVEKRIAELCEQAAKKDVEFLTSFKTAYKSMSLLTSQPKGNEGRNGFSALFERNKNLTTKAWSLINNFQHISQHVKNLDTKKFVQNNWKQEDKSLAKLLKTGKKVGMEKAQVVVTASKQTRRDAGETLAEKVLYDEETSIKEGWGKVARKQEKAMRKLARSLEK